MGCSVEKNFTSTTTHTYTDADGNTVTTTTTNDNGKVTKETTTTTADEAMSAMEEEMAVEEVSDVASYEKVPVSFTNNMGWDIAEFYIKMSNQDEWSENFIPEGQFIYKEATADGVTVNYNEEDHFMDIRVADYEGEGEEFMKIDLPAEGADEIVLSFEYDASTGLYTVSSIS